MRIPDRHALLITVADHGDPGAPTAILRLDFDGLRLDGPPAAPIPDEVPFLINAYRERRNVRALGHFYPLPARQADPGPGASHRPMEILAVRCQSCPSRYAGLCRCVDGQRQAYGGANILAIENDGIVTLGRDLAQVCRRAVSAAGLGQPAGDQRA